VCSVGGRRTNSDQAQRMKHKPMIIKTHYSNPKNLVFPPFERPAVNTCQLIGPRSYYLFISSIYLF
jgi:hypothetical protein